jgi:hypothetical protein
MRIIPTADCSRVNELPTVTTRRPAEVSPITMGTPALPDHGETLVALAMLVQL